MEKFTKQFYLENRRKTRYTESILFIGPGACYGFEEMIKKLNEAQKRMCENKWAKERAVESLKHLIDRNPQEAVEYIKEKNLI